jgi:glutamate dehydrogenase (NAD(P)+)
VELHRRGARIVGVGDVHTGLLDDRGLEIPELQAWIADTGGMAGFPGAREVAPAEILEHPCDVLVPAALEGQITGANADRLACRLIVEAANGPTTPEAEAMLAERGILIVPDVLANGGGVTVSYFEWVQDVQRFSWSSDALRSRLREQMREALKCVTREARELNVDWRTAALAVAVKRVSEAASARGVYP